MSNHVLRALVSEYFDPNYYLNQNEDVRAAGVEPIDHWFSHGCIEGRHPAPWFDEKTLRATLNVPLNENAFHYLLKTDIAHARKLKKAWIKQSPPPIALNQKPMIQPYYSLRKPHPSDKPTVFTAIIGSRHVLPNNTTDWPSMTVYSDEIVDVDRWNFQPAIYWNNNKKLSVLFHKYCLASLYPDGTKLIWVDSRVSVQRHVLEDIASALEDYDICTFKHYERDCVFDELVEVVRGGRASFDEARDCEAHLHKIGYPRNGGLFETGVFGIKTNPEVCRVLRKTFGLSQKYISRDQITLNMALKDSGISVKMFNDGQTNLRNTPGVFLHSW